MANNRNAQIRKIWAMARELGWDSDTLHEMAYRWTGTMSISGMNKEQRMVVLDNLVHAWRKTYGIPTEGPSDPQLWKIYDLARQLEWDFLRLAGFCERVAGVSMPEHLNERTASKVIEGLKAMLKKKKAHAQE
jgi:hypothetical protein